MESQLKNPFGNVAQGQLRRPYTNDTSNHRHIAGRGKFSQYLRRYCKGHFVRNANQAEGIFPEIKFVYPDLHVHSHFGASDYFSNADGRFNCYGRHNIRESPIIDLFVVLPLGCHDDGSVHQKIRT